MKKVWFLLLAIGLLPMQVFAKDLHQFTCEDSDKGSFVSNPPGRTHFTWTKNGKQIFNRIFTDTYSASRDKYVTFFCEKKIIRYELHSCDNAETKALCGEDKKVEIKLNIGQRKVTTNATLIDGDDYNFVTHYQLTSLGAPPVYIKALYFMSDVDGDGQVSETERQAALQYEYVLMGPKSELVSGVTTEDGKLYFDISANPILVEEAETNIGIAAKSKAGLTNTNNSSIRWLFNQALGAKGLEATSGGEMLSYDEVGLVTSRPGIFSRGTSGLKITHFSPQKPLFSPSDSAQPFYRFRAENLSANKKVLLKRATLDMRVIGLEKKGGKLLDSNDFSLTEITELGQNIGVPDAIFSTVEDARNSSKALTLELDLDDFEIPPNGSRILEVRVAHIVNDSEGKDTDDGAAVQLRSERFLDGSKYRLEALSGANWVWSDLSEPMQGDQRSDWRSGINLSLYSGAIIMKE